MDNDFEPVVGRRFNFRSTPIESEVLVIEPGLKLVYSWVALGLESTVTWTLSATASGTLVRMEHSGFGADQDAAYKGANYGWQKFIGSLERVVAGLE
jgi:uncharacterized protein YndB with AHSA1/START domain